MTTKKLQRRRIVRFVTIPKELLIQDILRTSEHSCRYLNVAGGGKCDQTFVSDLVQRMADLLDTSLGHKETRFR